MLSNPFGYPSLEIEIHHNKKPPPEKNEKGLIQAKSNIIYTQLPLISKVFESPPPTSQLVVILSELIPSLSTR